MRRATRQEPREITVLRERLRTLWPLLEGSVVVLRRPCTRPGCRRCAGGEKHPATYLSLRRAGKTQLAYLPAPLIAEVTRGVANYRRVHEAVVAATRPWIDARKLPRRPPR